MDENRIVDIGPFEIPDLPSRMARVFAPAGFSKQRYRPLLVMFDGQNIFDDEPSFAGGWHVHELVSALPVRSYFRPAIVGINHGEETRLDGLGPFATPQGGGKTDNLLTWAGEILLPMLKEHLDLIGGPLGTVVGGSSMGGLAALYAHFKRPDLFGGALAMSPSLWFGREEVFSFVTSQPTPNPSRIYFDWGAREGRDMIDPAEAMAAHLKSRGYAEKQLMIRRDAKGRHSEADWRRRLPKALRFMFRR